MERKVFKRIHDKIIGLAKKPAFWLLLLSVSSFSSVFSRRLVYAYYVPVFLKLYQMFQETYRHFVYSNHS